MSAHAVTLRLPAPLYEHFQGRAERALRSLEAELLEAVAAAAASEEGLASDVAEAIRDLKLLSAEELWRAARHRLADDTRSQSEARSSDSPREGLAPGEREVLEQLVHHYEQAVLLREQAARLLKGRVPEE
jgi:hypothetical protein